MKNKGFTLIELLGVIIIVALIIILALPKVTTSVKSKKTELALLNDDIVYTAAKLYVSEHKSDFVEENDTYACIEISDLDDGGYLGDEVMSYDNTNYNFRYVRVGYNDGFTYALTNECEPSTNNKELCTGNNCKACYISKTYNNGVYQYKGEILESNDPNAEISLSDDEFIIYTSDYGCRQKAVELATKEFLNNNRNDYPVENDSVYCIGLSNPLYESRYITSPILNNSNVNIVPTYSSEVKYVNGAEVITIKESSNCHETHWYDPKMQAGFVPVVYVKSSSNSSIYDNYTQYSLSYAQYGDCSTKTTYATGYWVVADPDSTWYDYDNFMWPNAVLLKPGVNKAVGDRIDTTNDIVGMFVWVPRYEYKLGANYSSLISVNLITEKDHTVTPGYRVPEAFTFGDRELGGFWAGKFVTTGTLSEPTIKPRQSYLETTFKKAFDMALGFDEKYGMDSTKYDSHMMKNSEYAAVLYLAESNYGHHAYPYRNSYHIAPNCSTVTASSNGATSSCTVVGSFDGSEKDYNYLNDHRKVVTCEQYNSYNLAKTVVTNSNWSVGTNSYSSDSGNNANAYTATLVLSFTVEQGKNAKLSFKYEYTSALDTYSDFKITIKNTSTGSTVSTLTGSISSKSYNKVLPAGNYTITAKFTKDKSTFSTTKRQRKVQISNFSLVAGPWHDVVSTEHKNGVAASSSGTVYGIYDLGVMYHILAVIGDTSSTTTYTKLGFTSYPERKYYDTMYIETSTSDSVNTLCNGHLCYGHAMPIETFEWGYDSIGEHWLSFQDGLPVFHRMWLGEVSLFEFATTADASHSSRIVLSQP